MLYISIFLRGQYKINYFNKLLDNALNMIYILSIMTPQEIRPKLEKFLYERNWTLAQGAKYFEVSKATLSLFLNGKVIPHPRTLYRYKKLMGIQE
jgi:hypothetical protein